MQFNHEHIPFTLSDNNDIDMINYSDSMKFCESLPTLEEIYETTKFSNFPKPMEEGSILPSNLNSKYHSVRDFLKLKIQKISIYSTLMLMDKSQNVIHFTHFSVVLTQQLI